MVPDAGALGGKLTSFAAGALEKRPVVERVAALLTDRFLGVNLVDLIKEIDRSDPGLSRLGESGWLERVAATISARAGGGGEDKGSGQSPQGSSVVEVAKPVAKGAATMGGLALLKRVALPLAVAVASVTAVLVVWRVKSHKKMTTDSEPAVVTTERESVDNEAARGGEPPSGL